MIIRRDVTKIAVTAIALSGTVFAAIVAPALAQSLPNGNGKELVETICTACHDLSPITGGGFSRQDWDTVVKSMIDMGAQIKPDEATVIINYLATNFPPKANQ